MSREPSFSPLAEREHAVIVPEIARGEAAPQEQDQLGRAHADLSREGEHIGDRYAIVWEPRKYPIMWWNVATPTYVLIARDRERENHWGFPVRAEALMKRLAQHFDGKDAEETTANE